MFVLVLNLDEFPCVVTGGVVVLNVNDLGDSVGSRVWWVKKISTPFT